MAQIILFITTNNGVAVCRPTGEKPIEQVLAEDCPSGAWIADESILPVGENDFFDAWEWNGSIIINMQKARELYLKMINTIASQQASLRSSNTSIGLPNNETEQEFLDRLNSARTAIANATSTVELRLIKI